MAPTPALIVCMGTSGCGQVKSSIDDLHPASNVVKMSEGHPLTDEDRILWLLRIRATGFHLTSQEGVQALAHPVPAEADHIQPSDELTSALAHVHPQTIHLGKEMIKRERKAVVVGCSALKRGYRELLSGRKVQLGEVSIIEPEIEADKLETYFIYREWIHTRLMKYISLPSTRRAVHGTRPLLLHRLTSRPRHFFKAAPGYRSWRSCGARRKTRRYYLRKITMSKHKPP
ncbi:BZ3500_MvSof-1268-A1-R1_Chr6-3g08777 [Microbotryum saponariae]|uniref:gluconokinase n=1 Tax=Microbotryum saponariae TaxID=289078 RepID=A0A2X0MH96_9BASI|nr:BZ3500_MvSof-1268-A1-R1_Chr6-3g08777 [Microbotryum saponariae]SDA07378.1 BZ3501_MvSof-1269-A2-R1_Chr6-2g08480 [Microbotryum saponariae]